MTGAAMVPAERRETLQYIASMLEQLRAMAVAGRELELVYLIEMALEEAKAQLDRVKPN
jgi:hypothetical protein